MKKTHRSRRRDSLPQLHRHKLVGLELAQPLHGLRLTRRDGARRGIATLPFLPLELLPLLLGLHHRDLRAERLVLISTKKC